MSKLESAVSTQFKNLLKRERLFVYLEPPIMSGTREQRKMAEAKWVADLNDASVSLSEGRALAVIWRQNVYSGKTIGGRFIRCGLPGMSDYGGMDYRGRTVSVEIKTETGRQSPPQVAWSNFMQSLDCVYLVVRDAEVGLNELKKAVA